MDMALILPVTCRRYMLTFGRLIANWRGQPVQWNICASVRQYAEASFGQMESIRRKKAAEPGLGSTARMRLMHQPTDLAI
ncbi:hypothetical protein [Alicyclobacillus mali (ex Roth et al. 2021)]|uniref:hypothetical protein n=1 Tax=Alicyclobacillus mali (ex Roth et al. 2021) TaxID=1123961 RepID=UPI001A8CCABD|nr:hypothetical protein [Alicyclobacillus mali (ex Roth et al. 2021)]